MTLATDIIYLAVTGMLADEIYLGWYTTRKELLVEQIITKKGQTILFALL